MLHSGFERVRESTTKYETFEGARVGLLRLERICGKAKNGSKIWSCVCDCGNTKEIVQSSLRAGLTRSCGCLFKENVKNFSRTHGMTNTTEYNSWLAMKQRCLYEKHTEYANYGGRGISICDRWLEFSNFIEDMGFKPTPKHSIDRIDVNGNYEKSNCKWSDQIEQANNKRVRKSKSGVPGITWHNCNKWQLAVKQKYIGLYSTLDEAKEAKKLYESNSNPL